MAIETLPSWFDPDDDLDGVALSWLIEVEKSESSPELRAQFQVWLNAAPEHAAAYRRWAEFDTAMKRKGEAIRLAREAPLSL